MEKFIFDRTISDVIRAKELRSRPFIDLKVDEQAEYKAGLKGCYNLTDINRVENAIGELADIFSLYVKPISVNTKKWLYTDMFFGEVEVPRILDNLNKIRINSYDTIVPRTPTTIKDLNDANDVEKIMYNLYQSFLLEENNKNKRYMSFKMGVVF